ncbi:hypothetical protein, variant [Capsaspora owczarzaki ATCC 30864]|uniref:DH domain-containing protein n=1 Tax=Capsaspora owczarzaki (strain ATCC 30864) TaxID=595528 RepID=E9C618_CAPO3|nr:hypothetical protein CAOG_03749 [Capsaspora owczarzaki ATCC 30864]XP_011270318.1 hypothetical protein, variant [Capsaspora owczarzaki ATCC 30864]KJE92858.1 hypothetical protein CAOG_003749 [Capsaspora owczarzaki ATCC 30864]|eukprot:XP_004363477.1 hypothetical protein CAOG_03749 [Capsaspora owczarzaki ATCC 30864]
MDASRTNRKPEQPINITTPVSPRSSPTPSRRPLLGLFGRSQSAEKLVDTVATDSAAPPQQLSRMGSSSPSMRPLEDSGSPSPRGSPSAARRNRLSIFLTGVTDDSSSSDVPPARPHDMGRSGSRRSASISSGTNHRYSQAIYDEEVSYSTSLNNSRSQSPLPREREEDEDSLLNYKIGVRRATGGSAPSRAQAAALRITTSASNSSDDTSSSNPLSPRSTGIASSFFKAMGWRRYDETNRSNTALGSSSSSSLTAGSTTTNNNNSSSNNSGGSPTLQPYPGGRSLKSGSASSSRSDVSVVSESVASLPDVDAGTSSASSSPSYNSGMPNVHDEVAILRLKCEDLTNRHEQSEQKARAQQRTIATLQGEMSRLTSKSESAVQLTRDLLALLQQHRIAIPPKLADSVKLVTGAAAPVSTSAVPLAAPSSAPSAAGVRKSIIGATISVNGAAPTSVGSGAAAAARASSIFNKPPAAPSSAGPAPASKPVVAPASAPVTAAAAAQKAPITAAAAAAAATTASPPATSAAAGSANPYNIPRLVKVQAQVRGFLARRNHKRAVRRSLVVGELLATEMTYVKTLRTIERWYLKPLTAYALQAPGHETVILSLDEIERVFGKVPDMLKVHAEFLTKLQERMDRWNVHQTIGQLVINLASQLEIYTAYVNNFTAASLIINSHKNDSNFKKFLEDKRDFHGIKEALADLLITPVQRIPRYSLLLEQILKYTASSSPDYNLLRGALEKIKRVAEMINECKRAAQIVEDIEARLTGCPEPLFVPDRQLMLDCDVVELKDGRPKLRHLFLFNDILLCATPRDRSGSFSIIGGQPKPGTGQLPGIGSPNLGQYQFKLLHSLSDIDVREPDSVSFASSGGSTVTSVGYSRDDEFLAEFRSPLQIIHWKTTGKETYILLFRSPDLVATWIARMNVLKKQREEFRARQNSFRQSVIKKRDSLKKKARGARSAIPKFDDKPAPTASKGKPAAGSPHTSTSSTESIAQRLRELINSRGDVDGTPIGEIRERIAELEKEIAVEEQILVGVAKVRRMYEAQSAKMPNTEIDRQSTEATKRVEELRAELVLCNTALQLHSG